MELIDTGTTEAYTFAVFQDVEDLEGKSLSIAITEEGMILDVYGEDDLLGSVGMTAEEWIDFILERTK